MRIRVRKAATINRHTQQVPAEDLTVPIHTGPRSRTAPEEVEGELVQFVRWRGQGQMDFIRHPASVDQAIEYERPLVLWLGRSPTGKDILWHTSPLFSFWCGAYGLPSRCETRSSIYEIEWLVYPVLPIEDVAQELDSGPIRG